MTNTTPHTFDDEVRIPGEWANSHADWEQAQEIAQTHGHDITGAANLGLMSLAGQTYTRYRTPAPAPAPAVDTYRHDAHCTGRYDCHCRACQ